MDGTDEELLTGIAKRVQSAYFGKYRAFVVDNADPEGLARLRLRVPAALGNAVSGWALPALPIGGVPGSGAFWVPENDAQVWAEFEQGDLSLPIWTGTFWQQRGDQPADAVSGTPTTRVLRTPAGHVLQFDDEADAECLRLAHPAGAQFTIDPDGVVVVTDAAGSTVTLDAKGGELRIEEAGGNTITMASAGTTVEDPNGNRVELASGGVTVKGQQVVVDASTVMLGGQGGEPVIKGQSFLTLFATHVHTSPGPGPTTPPVPQGEMTTLSTKVLTS